MNDRWVKDIVLDTGATKTIFRGDLVTEEDMVGSSIIVKCAHGDEVAYPVARVKIVVEGVMYTLEVAFQIASQYQYCWVGMSLT